MENFEVKKNIWTDADLNTMGWHDCPIYEIALKNLEGGLAGDLNFDIDYIFKWIHPTPPEEYFSFWISPCTLAFKNVYNLEINIEAGQSSSFELEIDDIHRLTQVEYSDDIIHWKWHIQLQHGNIEFDASGYDQIIKRKPVYVREQRIPPNQRGEANFSLIPFSF